MVEVGDEVFDAGLELGFRGEAFASQELAHRDREPDLDLIEPGGMLGGEMEGDPVAGVAQKGLAAGEGFEDAALAFFPELLFDAAVAGHQTHDALGDVGVEVVANDTPLMVRRVGAEEAVALMREQGLMRLPVLNARDEVVGIVTYMDTLSEKPRRKPYKVTFYKDMTGSHGQHKDVPVHTVYVTGVDGKEKAEGEAIKRFESDKHAQPWTTAANGFDVEQPLPKTERPAKR